MKLGFGISNVQDRQIIKNKNRALSVIGVWGRVYIESMFKEVFRANWQIRVSSTQKLKGGG